MPIIGERDGFTFDAGPTVITDPACLEELWALTGRSMSEDVKLDPVSPFYRLNWVDGTNFDYSNDDTQLRSEIAKLNPTISRAMASSSTMPRACTAKAMRSSAMSRFSTSPR